MTRRAARQLLFISLSLAAWSAIGRANLLMLLLAYLGVLLAWEVPIFRRVLEPLRTPQLVWLAVLIAVPALLWGYRMRVRIAEQDGLVGFGTRVADRLRLEITPSIAPPLFSADRPQTFFVNAPGAKRVNVRFGSTVHPLLAESLGYGLFRVDYDPRRDGLPTPADGALRTTLIVDDRNYERELRAVTPLPHPRWFCLSPNAELAATPSEETDELIVVGALGSLRRLPTGDGPADCAFLDDSTIAVSQRFDGHVSVIDLASGRTVRSPSVGALLGRMALSADRKTLVVARAGRQPELLVLAAPQLEVRARLPLTAAADWIAFGPDTNTLIVTTGADASLLRFARYGVGYVPNGVLRLGRPAVTLARSSDGQRIWIAATDYRPQAAPQLGNHFVQDQLLTVDVATWMMIDQRFTARRSERQSKPGDVDQGGSPMGMHQLRDGRLAVVFAGTDELWRLPANATLDVGRFDLGDNGLHAPHGVVELADGSVLVSSPVVAAIGWLAPGARQAKLLRLAPNDPTLLAKNPDALARRLGERGFYESTRAGIACQSCHVHADSDEAGYNLGDHRLVPTLSVRGLLGTAPYLRDGSYPRIRDLDDVAQTLYRGYLRDQPGRKQTLEAFVESLPRATSLAGSTRDRSAERRGLAAFEKAHCDRCHAPPAFTNLGLLPMRALFPLAAANMPMSEMIDVPSLLSVSATAPYLNDGRAKTLDAVIHAQNPAHLHGDIRALSAPEQRDLLTFLSSL